MVKSCQVEDNEDFFEHHKAKPTNTSSKWKPESISQQLIISHWEGKEEQEDKCLEKHLQVLELSHTNCP